MKNNNEHDLKKLVVATSMSGMVQAAIYSSIIYPDIVVKNHYQHYKNTKYIPPYPYVNGFFNLYKNSSSFFLEMMAIRSIQFSSAEYLQTKINYGSNNMILINFINGGIAGAASSIISISFKNIRTMDIIKNYIVGSSFIGSYFTLRSYVGDDTWYKNFMNGSIARSITSLVCIPIDNYINYNKFVHHNHKLKIRKYVNELYKHNGFNGLFSMWRNKNYLYSHSVIPATGIAMIGYEYTKQLIMNSYDNKEQNNTLMR